MSIDSVRSWLGLGFDGESGTYRRMPRKARRPEPGWTWRNRTSPLLYAEYLTSLPPNPASLHSKTPYHFFHLRFAPLLPLPYSTLAFTSLSPYSTLTSLHFHPLLYSYRLCSVGLCRIPLYSALDAAFCLLLSTILFGPLFLDLHLSLNLLLCPTLSLHFLLCPALLLRLFFPHILTSW